MNRSGFNAATINGGYGDSTVRSVVLAYAAAFITASNRVLRKDSLTLTPTATVTTAVGRVYAKSPQDLQVQASISFGYRAYIRFTETCQAAASIVNTAYKRALNAAGINVQVSIALTAHKRASGMVEIAPRASISYASRGMVRLDAAFTASASIVANATVKVQTYVRDTFNVLAIASVIAVATRRARDPLAATGEAHVTANGMVRLRDALNVQARAVVLANSEAFRMIPFDRPAPADRVLVMPPTETHIYLR